MTTISVKYAPYTFDLADKVFRNRATGSTVSAREICISLEERDALRAENARLRTTLMNIEGCYELIDAKEISRAALGGGK